MLIGAGAPIQLHQLPLSLCVIYAGGEGIYICNGKVCASSALRLGANPAGEAVQTVRLHRHFLGKARVIGQMVDDGKRLPSIVFLHQGKVRITGRARIRLRVPGGGHAGFRHIRKAAVYQQFFAGRRRLSWIEPDKKHAQEKRKGKQKQLFYLFHRGQPFWIAHHLCI